MFTIEDKPKILITLLFWIDDWTNIDVKAMWADSKFGLTHGREIEKLTIVGDTWWAKWLIRLARSFYALRVHYFPTAQFDQAWQWLHTKLETNSHPA